MTVLELEALPTLVQEVTRYLTDALRRLRYKGHHNPLAGHCYVASESLYYLLGGRGSGWVPQSVKHEGDTHWYLKHKDSGYILDATASQFTTPVPYEKGRGRGFLTRAPSKRARVVLDRIQRRV